MLRTYDVRDRLRHIEGERDFWDDIPTYSRTRVRIGSRSHGGAAPPRRRPLFDAAAPGERNIRRRRLAALAGAGVFLVGLGLTAFGGDGNGSSGANPVGGPTTPVVNTVVMDSTGMPLATTTLTIAPPALAARPCPAGQTYVVAAGDYWIGIADRTQVPLSDLLAANGATHDTPLDPTSSICLPPPNT